MADQLYPPSIEKNEDPQPAEQTGMKRLARYLSFLSTVCLTGWKDILNSHRAIY